MTTTGKYTKWCHLLTNWMQFAESSYVRQSLANVGHDLFFRRLSFCSTFYERKRRRKKTISHRAFVSSSLTWSCPVRFWLNWILRKTRCWKLDRIDTYQNALFMILDDKMVINKTGWRFVDRLICWAQWQWVSPSCCSQFAMSHFGFAFVSVYRVRWVLWLGSFPSNTRAPQWPAHSVAKNGTTQPHTEQSCSKFICNGIINTFWPKKKQLSFPSDDLPFACTNRDKAKQGQSTNRPNDHVWPNAFVRSPRRSIEWTSVARS